jgi:hypothetical protein
MKFVWNIVCSNSSFFFFLNQQNLLEDTTSTSSTKGAKGEYKVEIKESPLHSTKTKPAPRKSDKNKAKTTLTRLETAQTYV